jgi:hypothetical protein
MTQTIRLSELVSLCCRAGERACARIRSIHESGDLKAIEKGDGNDKITGRPMTDIQTEADRQSEFVVFSTLRKVFPALHVRIFRMSKILPRLLEKKKVRVS